MMRNNKTIIITPLIPIKAVLVSLNLYRYIALFYPRIFLIYSHNSTLLSSLNITDSNLRLLIWIKNKIKKEIASLGVICNAFHSAAQEDNIATYFFLLRRITTAGWRWWCELWVWLCIYFFTECIFICASLTDIFPQILRFHCEPSR